MTPAEHTTYLGFPILVRENTTAIFDPKTGVKLYDGAMAWSSVRRFIRGYRKEDRAV